MTLIITWTGILPPEVATGAHIYSQIEDELLISHAGLMILK